ncbi:MAG: hypothetical protein KDK39_02575 [Leptospiraceae bacterium]|nr:hypothetical protein [Leptospiraceae bacterium]
MKSISILIFCISSAFCGLYAQEQGPANYSQAYDVYWQAHKAFAQNQHEKAMQLLKKVEAYTEVKPEHKNFFDHGYRNFSLIDMVEKHRDLGKIQADTIHKVLVLYIMKTDIKFRKQHIHKSFTPELKDTAYISQEICKKYMEVMSGGKLSLEFDRMDLNSVLTGLDAFGYKGPSKAPMETVHSRLESLQPYPGELLLEKYNEYDTFMFYYHSGGLSLPNGGGATAVGGSLNFYFTPYGLSGPRRGRLMVSERLINKPGTLFHEFFHTIEQRYGIQPGHGFWPHLRKNFPEWKGEGEFDYYRYHFGKIAKTAGFEKFEFHESWPSNATKTQFSEMHQKMRRIPMTDLQKAESLFIKAQESYVHGNKDAKKLLYRVIKLNPYHYRALYYLTILENTDKNSDLAFELIRRAYKINPYDSLICYWMGVKHFHIRELDESIKYLSESLANDPVYDSAWQYRGFVHYQKGEYNQALADFKSCLEKSDRFRNWITEFLEGRQKSGDLEAGEMLEKLSL